MTLSNSNKTIRTIKNLKVMRNVAHITTRVSKSTLIIGVVSVDGYTIS